MQQQLTTERIEVDNGLVTMSGRTLGKINCNVFITSRIEVIHRLRVFNSYGLSEKLFTFLANKNIDSLIFKVKTARGTMLKYGISIQKALRVKKIFDDDKFEKQVHFPIPELYLLSAGR